MSTKYLSKEMIQVNPELRVYKYYYAGGCALYLVNRNTAVETIKIWVPYPEEKVEDSENFHALQRMAYEG